MQYTKHLHTTILTFFFSTCTRLSLTLYNLYLKTIDPVHALGALGVGVLYDLKLLTVIFWITYAIYYLCKKLPAAWDGALKGLHFIYLLIVIFALSFQMFAEWIFWGDMECRFNFIAVDYLIYTHEVIQNIVQSYPIKTYFLLMGFSTLILGYLVQRYVYISTIATTKAKKLFLCSLLVFVLPISSWTSNNFATELSENGTLNFLHAFFNNQLEYEKFYKKQDSHTTNQSLQTYLGGYLNTFSSDPIQRDIKSTRELKKLNVVLITVESLSKEFLEKTPTWTPFIKNLEPDCITFEDHYATGTRTVRGLEALTLSVPPTPGSSILRRPHHDNLFNISTVLIPLGYQMEFWYGGYGYFDNMNAFYEKNGFKVFDRLSIPSEKIEHETIWGVSDEHLFDAFLENLDTAYDRNKPFFSLIMTTSNHRPYTFPKNRIECPMGTREAAVKYTDWAIEQFMKKAKTKPWYDNTLFVITADHCASSAGKLKVDPSKYLTPCFFYSPNHFKAQKISSRTSQIDVIPSILGLLGVSYKSRFYGIDQIHTPQDRPVPLGTYQRLGYFGKKEFIILSPKQDVEVYAVSDQGYERICAESSKELPFAIGLYQNASHRYAEGLMDTTSNKGEKID
jgi:phosphoglycerol transferase MdoB-like AlkP superfamily enzyme